MKKKRKKEKVDEPEELEFQFTFEVEGEEARSGPLVIKRELKRFEIIEIEDFNFNHDSAVLLPIRNALPELACCYLYAMENPSRLMMIAGHTDRTGNPRYNDWLSEKRAENVLNILLGEREDWVDSVCVRKPPRPLQKRPDGKSKVEDYQMILQWVANKYRWPCDPGEVKDDWPAYPGPTKKAIEVFQDKYNNEPIKELDGKSIRELVGGESIDPVDGLMGPQTWGAFFDVYMVELAELLELDSDTSRLETYRNALKFVDGHKIVRCGETHVIDRNDPREHSLEDRRVHILFFDPDEKPKLKHHPFCHKPKNKTLGELRDPDASKRADECELYGKKGIYVWSPVTCRKYAPAPPTEPKIFLEVEIFDLAKNEEWAWGFVGRGDSAEADSFEKFEDGFSIFGLERKEELERKERTKGKIFGVDLKDWWLEKTIKIQAERKYVANRYDDGERAWQHVLHSLIPVDSRVPGDKKCVSELKDEKGEWPEKVLLEYRDEQWPTEECLARIYIYLESEEAEYNEEKIKKVIPLLNKILILKKEGKIEYVVDRFVSF